MVPASEFPNIWFLQYNNNQTITLISLFTVLQWQLRVHLCSHSLFPPLSFSTSPSAACSHEDSGDWNISEKKLISQHAAHQSLSNCCQVETFQPAPEGFPNSPLLQGCMQFTAREAVQQGAYKRFINISQPADNALLVKTATAAQHGSGTHVFSAHTNRLCYRDTSSSGLYYIMFWGNYTVNSRLSGKHQAWREICSEALSTAKTKSQG